MDNQQTLSCDELEFLSEFELVEIIPRFEMDELKLCEGTFGPFTVNVACLVPLWLAIALRKRDKCTIKQPNWLTVKELSKKLQQEKNKKEEGFEEFPFHYLEIGLQLLEVASQDFEDAEKIRVLLEDCMNIREHKFQSSLPKHSISGLDVTNISAMELNKNRLFMTKAMYMLQKLKETTFTDNSEIFDDVEE